MHLSPDWCFLDLFCPHVDKHKYWTALRASPDPCWLSDLPSFNDHFPELFLQLVFFYFFIFFWYLGFDLLGWANLSIATFDLFQHSASLARFHEDHLGPRQRWRQRGWERLDAVRRVTWRLPGHHLHLVVGRAGRRPAGGQPALRAHARKTSAQLLSETPRHLINVNGLFWLSVRTEPGGWG